MITSDDKDIENFGDRSRWNAVRADLSDSRNWLANSPICPTLKTYAIAHVGEMWAQSPFKVIRSSSSGTFALMSMTGTGEVFVDGKWQSIQDDQICLLPAFASTGIRVQDDHIWNFTWVRYEENQITCPILSSNTPVIQKGNSLTLKHAIAGLSAETSNKQIELARLHHWVELIHSFVTKVAIPFQGDQRLWPIWQRVEQNLRDSWTLARLAKIGNMSEEHLRRLTNEQLGRSPIQHVTYLRIRHAVHLLTSTSEKIESIAREVGYENPFTFSNAFKRWTGKRPSEYRK